MDNCITCKKMKLESPAEMSDLKLIISIIQYLKEESKRASVNADTRESLEVAVQCLQTAYDLEPNDPRLNEKEAFSLASLFDIAQASSSTEATIDGEDVGDPIKKAEMMKNFGNNLMKKNMHSEAVRYYTAAIDLDGQNAIYYGNRAAAYSKLGDFKNAVIDCEKAVHVDPLYAKAYGRLGLAYASLNRHDEAVAAFKRALELDPDNESYKSNLKIALEKEKPQMGGDTPPAMPGPLAGLAQVDWRTLFSNPIFRNMASSLMQDPNIISALTSTMTTGMNPNAATGSRGEGEAPAPSLDSGNMNVLYEAGQYLAAQLQAANPDLVEQIRQNTSRNNPQGPDGSSAE